jgi:hypothetical protein
MVSESNVLALPMGLWEIANGKKMSTKKKGKMVDRVKNSADHLANLVTPRRSQRDRQSVLRHGASGDREDTPMEPESNV